MFDKRVTTVIFILIPGLLIDAWVQYSSNQHYMLFYRDVLHLIMIVLLFLLFRFSVIRKNLLLSCSVYSFLISITFTLIYEFISPFLNDFESLFLQAEILLILLTFATSQLIHYNQIFVMLIYNFLMIVFCKLTIGQEYPLSEYIYYGFLVTGPSLMLYISQKVFVKLRNRMHHANNVITMQNEKLEEMNRYKDQLFSIIGHDLRTPFHQLKSFVELFGELEKKEEKEEVMKLVKESADKGSKLLEELLSFGKTYTKDSKIALEKKLIHDTVESSFDFSRYNSKQKGITLVNSLPRNLELLVNPTMMETIFRNLISNAIKFSKRNTMIKVDCTVIDQKIRIDIQDQGVGMDELQLENLFSSDKHLSTEGTNKEKGTGLGLRIAKQLTEKQNGKLKVLSNIGKGTTIQLFFPLIHY